MKNEALLSHVVEGKGPPLVLLNGGMMTYPYWEPMAARFRERFQLLRFDFRGQLLSPGKGPASLAGHAEEVAALLDALGWPSAHFIGTSFGAEVAIELASRQSSRFRSLVAITAMDRETAEFRRQNEEMQAIVREILAGGPREPFWKLLVEGVYSPAYRKQEEATFAARGAQLDLMPRVFFEGLEQILQVMEDFDLGPGLADRGFPSLVVIAAGDLVMAPERSCALASAIGAEVLVHAGSGHGLVAEDPEWLTDRCLEFLARTLQHA